MRNLARGRVIERIIAQNSIPLHRNVRNAPAAVRLSRIFPARSHRASAMQSAEAKLHRRAKALVCAGSPARSENRPAAVRPSSSEKHRALGNTAFSLRTSKTARFIRNIAHSFATPSFSPNIAPCKKIVPRNLARRNAIPPLAKKRRAQSKSACFFQFIPL